MLKKARIINMIIFLFGLSFTWCPSPNGASVIKIMNMLKEDEEILCWNCLSIAPLFSDLPDMFLFNSCGAIKYQKEKRKGGKRTSYVERTNLQGANPLLNLWYFSTFY